jgi:hypothetical protein
LIPPLGGDANLWLEATPGAPKRAVIPMSAQRSIFERFENLGSSNGWSERITRRAITNDVTAATIANAAVAVLEFITRFCTSDMATSDAAFLSAS